MLNKQAKTNDDHSQSDCESISLRLFDPPNFFCSLIFSLFDISVVPVDVFILLPPTGWSIDAVS
jgi:hypothetical protein